MVENQRNTFYKMREMRLPTVGCPPWLDVATTASPWMLPTAGPSVAPWGESIEIGIGEMEPAAAVMFSSLRIRLVLLVVSFHRTNYLPSIIINLKLSSIKETCMILEDRFWICLPIL